MSQHIIFFCCNPLAGIEVFHTAKANVPDFLREVPEVVIPWRGLRCFTRRKWSPEQMRDAYAVVIPWRGLRCFTLHDDITLTPCIR